MSQFQPSTQQTRNLDLERQTFLEAINTYVVHDIDTEYETISVNLLNKELKSTKLFLLGETHGVKENPNIIYTLFKRFNFNSLALEWDKKLQKVVSRFIATGDLEFETIKDSPDGRITAGHFSLLKQLTSEGLLKSLLYFDEDSPFQTWDSRDKGMAEYVLAHLTEGMTLVVAGNVHTETEPIVVKQKEENYPMGSIIKKKIPNLSTGRIKYLTGQFHNYGVKNFISETTPRDSAKAKFYRSSAGVYCYELPKAHPATIPNPTKT